MAIFEGSGVAIVTPFTNDGVDFAKLEKLIEFHIANKTDSIIICGSTGEAAAMSDEEHKAAIKCAVDTVAGRVPFIAGTGSNDTNYGIQLTKEAQKLGADAALVVTPYYNKCTPEGLYRHYPGRQAQRAEGRVGKEGLHRQAGGRVDRRVGCPKAL